MPVGRLLSLAVVVCVSIAPARAQRYGEVFGKIVDSSQGGVSDAAITIIDEDTGFRRTVQSETGGAGDLQRDDLVLEFSRLRRRNGALVALIGVFVEIVLGEAV